MNLRCSKLALCLAVAVIPGSIFGCADGGPDLSQVKRDTNSVESSQAGESGGEQADNSIVMTEVNEPFEEASEEELRQALTDYMAKFPDEKNWQFSERHANELAGTWEVKDETRSWVIFWPDGRCRESLNGNAATGLYAISEGGRVVTVSQWQEIRLGSHYRLQDQHLVGPRGPDPQARWERVGPVPEER